MSKAQKTTLIVATILLVSGLVITTAAFAAVGFNPRNLSTTNDWVATSNTLAAEAEAPHTAIVVRDASENVRVEPTFSDSIEIEYWENENKHFEVTDEGGVLTIEGVSKPHIDFMMIDLQDRTTVIKVPQSYAGTIDIETASGNISASDLAEIDSLTARTKSGNVSALRVEANRIDTQASSGNVTLDDITATDTKAITSSGNILVRNTQASAVSLQATSGNVSLDGVTAANIQAFASSGNVNASRCEGDGIALEATSGDIRAQINGSAEEYDIDTSTTSGNNHAPRGTTGAEKIVTIRTTSGNIELTFIGGTASNQPRGESGRGNHEDSSSLGAPEAPAVPEAPAAPAAPESPAAP